MKNTSSIEALYHKSILLSHEKTRESGEKPTSHWLLNAQTTKWNNKKVTYLVFSWVQSEIQQSNSDAPLGTSIAYIF